MAHKLAVATPAQEVLPASSLPPAWASAPLLELNELAASGARLVVITAHPLDETVGAGRLLAAWPRSFGSVGVISMTDGEACISRLGDRRHGGSRDIKNETGTALRRVMWHAALADLGVKRSAAPGFPGSSLERNRDHAVEMVSAFVREWTTSRPFVIASSWVGDPDPDHRAAARIARDVANESGATLLPFPIWDTETDSGDELHDSENTFARVRTSSRDEAVWARALARASKRSRFPGSAPLVPAEILAHYGDQLVIVPR